VEESLIDERRRPIDAGIEKFPGQIWWQAKGLRELKNIAASGDRPGPGRPKERAHRRRFQKANLRPRHKHHRRVPPIQSPMGWRCALLQEFGLRHRKPVLSWYWRTPAPRNKASSEYGGEHRIGKQIAITGSLRRARGRRAEGVWPAPDPPARASAISKAVPSGHG